MTTIAQKAVSLQLAKFHAIPTLRPMIFTSTFLPYMMISGARESPERTWQSVLHHCLFNFKLIDILYMCVCVCVCELQLINYVCSI